MLFGSSIADHANLLNYRNLVKRVNNQVKQVKKVKTSENFKNWLKTNKICLNISKTEVILFKS